jgi:hypothetical protein
LNFKNSWENYIKDIEIKRLIKYIVKQVLDIVKQIVKVGLDGKNAFA